MEELHLICPFFYNSMTAPRIPPSALKSGETDMPTTGSPLSLSFMIFFF